MRSGDKFNADTYLDYAGPVGALARDVLKKLDPQSGDKILDVGCGDGTITVFINNSGADVIGIDADSGMVREAVKKGVVAKVADIRELPFEKNSFNKIFSNSVLHWVSGLDLAFKEMARVLSDEGKICLEFGRRSPENIANAVISAAKYYGFDVKDKDPWHRNGKTQISNTLKSLGFKNIEIKESSKLQSFPAGIKAWMENFIENTFLEGIETSLREKIMDLAIEKLDKFPNHFNVGKKAEWFGDYKRILVTATLDKNKFEALGKYSLGEGGSQLTR